MDIDAGCSDAQTQQLVTHTVHAFQEAVSLTRERALKHMCYDSATDSLHVRHLSVDLHARPVALLGWGKSCAPVLAHLQRLLPGRRVLWCLGLTSTCRTDGMELLPVDHPLPTYRNLMTTRRVLKRLGELRRDAILLAVSTGGGSAMLWSPNQEVPWRDKAETLRRLLKTSLDCRQINNIRRCLSSVKGGRLLHYTRGIDTMTIAVSDDVLTSGRPLDSPSHVASGPTVPQVDDPKAAIRDIEAEGLTRAISPRVLDYLRSKALYTPTLRAESKERPAVAISDNDDLKELAAQSLVSAGFHVFRRRRPFFGDIHAVGEMLLEEFRCLSKRNSSNPLAYVAGGEATCSPAGDGLGGRCQHMAARWIRGIAGSRRIVALAAGSDGTDHVAKVAGAVVHSKSMQLCCRIGIDLDSCLKSYASFTIHKACDSLVRLATDGFNVGDLVIFAMLPSNGITRGVQRGT